MVFILYILINTLLNYSDTSVESSTDPRALVNDELPVSFEQDSMLWALEIQFGIMYGEPWTSDAIRHEYAEQASGSNAKAIQISA